MISSVRGPVLSALGSTVVIEVGGVGLAVQVTPSTALAARAGTETRLSTTLIVREDSLTLYGFPSIEELSVFELLVGVTGVGPKSALGVLAVMTPNQIAHAVAADDDAAFRKVSGVGPKTAKLIVLSLVGKVAVTAPAATSGRGGVATATVSATVQAALIGLGWSERVAGQAVDEILAGSTAEFDAEDAGVATVLRLALARLGPAQHAGKTAAAERRS
ncbi:Holliday junction branch migration protein RuvA [Cryobacterium sp. 1639]|uniref:Holliday junction branch migration protein RuvA n=1 Tax=Cryobacterium inferilacus TaxID=2866629 RepID=UPI001C735A1C|nr:Holliday junction branch migration protein RuvA [Cryobacterium sp. 1639]MBX0298477.1 Holliday junction branch migration protein RuvA [Cryobacterium sp. 1639]